MHTYGDKPSHVVLVSVDDNSASGIDINTRRPVQVRWGGGGGGGGGEHG